jgi:probable F420-dependent oxidoreductase
MKVDAVLAARPVAAGLRAQECEASGYDGAWIGEANHDPFVAATAAAAATSSVTVGTSVAIAFARSPMTVAYQAWDLAELSGGRFVLGLGTQVRAHIERRFGMPWSHPAARMREYVLGLRHIWASWRSGAPLAFEGTFYRHTLMTRFFTPETSDVMPPPVYLAAVGTRMSEVAGEVADGMFFHAFTTPSYLRQVTAPALARGRARRADRDPASFTVCGPVFVVTGATQEEMSTARTQVKNQIAFYASTRAYLPVLEHHGWGDVQPELIAMAKAGEWESMGALIDDDMLSEFAIVGPPEQVGADLLGRYGGLADRISICAPYHLPSKVTDQIIDAVRGVR